MVEVTLFSCQIKFPGEGGVNKQGNTFPKGFVGNFIGELNAMGVPLSTDVSGVGAATPFPNASKLPNRPLGIQEPNQPLFTTGSLLTAILPSEALPTPVKAAYLAGYNENSRKHLLSDCSHGFHLHFQGPLEGSYSNNLVSASEHSNIVDLKLAKEIQAGRMMGPFETPPLHNLKIKNVTVPASSSSFK